MSYLRIIDRLLSWVTDWLPPQSPTNKQTNKGTNKQTDKEKNKQTKERPTGCLHSHPTIFPTEALGWVPKKETMQNNQTNKQTKRQTNKRTNKNKPSSPHSVQYLLLYQRNVCFISSKKNTRPSGGQFGPHILLWLQTLSLQLSCCVSLKDFACKLDVLYPGAVSLYRGKEIHCWLGKLFLICKYWGKIAGGRLAGPLLVHIWPVWDLLGLSWLKWKTQRGTPAETWKSPESGFGECCSCCSLLRWKQGRTVWKTSRQTDLQRDTTSKCRIKLRAGDAGNFANPQKGNRRGAPKGE